MKSLPVAQASGPKRDDDLSSRLPAVVEPPAPRRFEAWRGRLRFRAGAPYAKKLAKEVAFSAAASVIVLVAQHVAPDPSSSPAAVQAPAPRSEIAQDVPAAPPPPPATTPPPVAPPAAEPAKVEKAPPLRLRAETRRLAKVATPLPPVKPAPVWRVAELQRRPPAPLDRGLAVPPPPIAKTSAPEPALQPLREGLALALDAGEFAAATNKRLILGAADAVKSFTRRWAPEPEAAGRF